MKHRFDIRNILEDIIGYRGVPFPGAYGVLQTAKKPSKSSYTGEDFGLLPEDPTVERHLLNGTQIYGAAKGSWYFMPVYLITYGGKKIEFPCTIVSVSGGNRIVETQLVGRKGSVNELISRDDLTITLAGMILSDDNNFPEEQISELKELLNSEESFDLVCAITDLLCDPDDRVIVKKYDFPPTPGLENGQAIKIELKTDKPFELTM